MWTNANHGKPFLFVHCLCATLSQKDHKFFSATYILCSKKHWQLKDGRLLILSNGWTKRWNERRNVFKSATLTKLVKSSLGHSLRLRPEGESNKLYAQCKTDQKFTEQKSLLDQPHEIKAFGQNYTCLDCFFKKFFVRLVPCLDNLFMKFL